MLLVQVPDKVYTTKQAAAYLNLSEAGLRKHLYKIKDLVADQTIGRTLLFTQATLDRFKEEGRLGRGHRKDLTE